MKINNGVSDFCSACNNGLLFLYRNISANCPNGSDFQIVPNCFFPCQPPNVLPNAKNALETNNYFQQLLAQLEVFTTFQFVENETTQGLVFPSPCNALPYINSIMSLLLKDIFPGVPLPVTRDDNTCAIIIKKYEPKKDYSFIAAIVLIVLVIFIVLIILLYYYFSSPLHDLPKEISWSFIDKLTHPW